MRKNCTCEDEIPCRDCLTAVHKEVHEGEVIILVGLLQAADASLAQDAKLRTVNELCDVLTLFRSHRVSKASHHLFVLFDEALCPPIL